MIVCFKHSDQPFAACLRCEVVMLREALSFTAKGYCGGKNRDMECKTVGNFHDQIYGPGNHCPVCWMNEAQGRALKALPITTGGTST
jgi:hypothetical protein